MQLSDRNVVFVTLDSCRWDVAAGATIPHLDSLSPPTDCESPGTYTLPAHAAYFNGFLPRPRGGEFHLDGSRFHAIWRSAAARPGAVTVAVPFDGRTIMEHYRRAGYRVLGAGGVTFFDSQDEANLLPSLFPEFRYYGRPARRPGLPAAGPVDRDESLTLSHVDELADECTSADRYFLFLNCASTHVPYTTPAGRLTPELTWLLQRFYRLCDSKTPPDGSPGLDPAERGQLIALQRTALEWADARLGRLFSRLRASEPLVVVCADHGEEFGEGGRYGHAHPHPSVTTVPLWAGVLR